MICFVVSSAETKQSLRESFQQLIYRSRVLTDVVSINFQEKTSEMCFLS